MRTTLVLDDELVRMAQELTGVEEKTALVREGLKALIARGSARRLAALGGTMPWLEDIPRRRQAPERGARRRNLPQVPASQGHSTDTADPSIAGTSKGKEGRVVGQAGGAKK